ncbi:MAG: DUF433 domain-containing protein [Halobacteriales archaeon]
MTITKDSDILGGEPHIKGRRVGVRHVVEMVIENGRTPAYVSDQLGLSMSEVYGALSYYYDNIEEIRAARRENEKAFDRLSDGSLKPKKKA